MLIFDEVEAYQKKFQLLGHPVDVDIQYTSNNIVCLLYVYAYRVTQQFAPFLYAFYMSSSRSSVVSVKTSHRMCQTGASCRGRRHDLSE